MSIVSSAITKDRDQGFARFVEESHTDSTGKVHVMRRFVPYGYDLTADLALHATQIAAQLGDEEAARVLNG
jgi:hypothetical protein